MEHTVDRAGMEAMVMTDFPFLSMPEGDGFIQREMDFLENWII